MTPWLDDEFAGGWFPDDCKLVPDLTSRIVGVGAVVIGAVTMLLVAITAALARRGSHHPRPTRRAGRAAPRSTANEGPSAWRR